MMEDSFAARDRERFEPDPEEYDGTFGAAVRPIPFGWIAFAALVILVGAAVYLRGRMIALGRWRPLAQVLAGSLRRRGAVPRWLDQWARYTELSSIERIFAGTGLMVRFLGGKSRLDRTPTEQIETLVGLMPESAQPARVVLEEYQRSVYSPYPVNVEQARQASNQLWKQALVTWFRRRLRIEVQVS